MKGKILEINNDYGEYDIAKEMVRGIKSGKKTGNIQWNFQKQNFLREKLFKIIADNEVLKLKLLETGDSILAECIKEDLDLGIGMAKGEENTDTMSKWKGRNILGYTLMQVREDIKKIEKGNLKINFSTIFPINLIIIEEDITRLEVDAIVNAANPSLLGGGGVDGAIHLVAGPELLEECRRLKGAETGEAKITKGYRLPSKYVIHTVGPIWKDGSDNEAQKLASCYRRSLALAYENNLHSIAFPSISTGAYRYPVEKAAYVAMETIVEFLQFNPDAHMKVIFVAFDRYTEKIYEQGLISVLKEIVYANAENISDCDIESIGEKNVRAFTLSEGGGMGASGCLCLYILTDEGMKIVFGNLVYDNLDIENLKEKIPVLSKIDVGVCGGSVIPEGWQSFYMGMGNHLVVQNDIAENVTRYLKNRECEWLYEYHDALLLAAIFNR